jgi:hypothetical protein
MKKKNKQTMSKTFTDKQLDKIVKLKENGATWEQIQKKLNKEFGLKASWKTYAGVGRRFTEKVKAAREPHPFAHFTKEEIGEVNKTNTKKKERFFITAVVAAAKVHKNAFAAVLSYCEKTGSELLLLPMNTQVKALEEQPNHYDPILEQYIDNFVTNYKFNENLTAVELHLNPQQIQPLTGISRIRGMNTAEYGRLIKSSKKTSILVAHTKQNMEIKATGNNSTPRMIHSTGAITEPDHLPNRIGSIAIEDHVLGGLILEINDDEFYVTQVQFNPITGTFVDKYANRYFPNGKVKKERAVSFVVGDIHPAHENKTANAVWAEVWDIIKPKKIFFHDWFGGDSISHHLEGKYATKAELPAHLDTLQSEIDYSRKVLYSVADTAPKDAELLLVASNHPEHLDKYLNQGRYLKDCKDNYRLGHRMIVDKLDGKNPLQSRLDPENRFTWLSRNQDYIIEGNQFGSHGDEGANGSRGSLVQHESINSSGVFAHSHTPGIYHGAYQIGHSSEERHGYNNGPSTWLICSAAMYEGGHKQLIIAMGKNWRL